jgi:hypothetical protein
MSYCRFENTSSDLGDCAEHILDRDLNDYEVPARVSLVETCVDILEALGFEVRNAEGVKANRATIEAAIEEFVGCADDPEDLDGEDEIDAAVHEADEKIGPGFGYPDKKGGK